MFAQVADSNSSAVPKLSIATTLLLGSLVLRSGNEGFRV